MNEKALKALGFSEYDSAEYLQTEEQVQIYLEESVEAADGDASLIAQALGTVARARVKMTKIASDAGLNRESLYKALSGSRDPAFSTILKVAAALGFKLAFLPLPVASRTYQESQPPALPPLQTANSASSHHTFIDYPSSMKFSTLDSPQDMNACYMATDIRRAGTGTQAVQLVQLEDAVVTERITSVLVSSSGATSILVRPDGPHLRH